MTEGDNRTYDPKDYVENSPFVRLLATPTNVKLLDVFLRNHFQELTASELAKYADVDQSSISRNIDQLVEEGIIEKTRTNENGQHYQLNKDNPAAKGFAQAQAELFSSFDEDTSEERSSDIREDKGMTESAKGIRDKMKEKNEALQDA